MNHLKGCEQDIRRITFDAQASKFRETLSNILPKIIIPTANMKLLLMLPDANPVCPFTDVVRSLWLPVCNSHQCIIVFPPWVGRNTNQVFIICDVLSGPSKELFVYDRRQCPRWTSGFWRFLGGKLEAYQVS